MEGVPALGRLGRMGARAFGGRARSEVVGHRRSKMTGVVQGRDLVLGAREVVQLRRGRRTRRALGRLQVALDLRRRAALPILRDRAETPLFAAVLEAQPAAIEPRGQRLARLRRQGCQSTVAVERPRSRFAVYAGFSAVWIRAWSRASGRIAISRMASASMR